MKWHDFEKLFDPDKHKRKPHHKHHAHSIRFKFTYKGFTFSGDNMTFTMLPGMSVLVTGFPVQADGSTVSKATLSAVTTVSSDPAVFTVVDSTTPGQATLTAVGAGTATMTQTAIATEPDGTTTEKISGAVTIVIATPPPAPAAAIAFTFGTPFPTVPNPPIPPVVP